MSFGLLFFWECAQWGELGRIGQRLEWNELGGAREGEGGGDTYGMYRRWLAYTSWQ